MVSRNMMCLITDTMDTATVMILMALLPHMTIIQTFILPWLVIMAMLHHFSQCLKCTKLHLLRINPCLLLKIKDQCIWVSMEDQLWQDKLLSNRATVLEFHIKADIKAVCLVDKISPQPSPRQTSLLKSQEKLKMLLRNGQERIDIETYQFWDF